MTEEYQHSSIRELRNLYEEYKDKLGHGGGMMRIMWMAVKPSIPQMLRDLDNNPELLVQAKPFLQRILAALEQDVGNADESKDD